MDYTDEPRSVRVDFFKESGKWYTTEAVLWAGDWSGQTLIHEAYRESLAHHMRGRGRLKGMTAVCLEPYHEHAHPITVKMDDRVYGMMEGTDSMAQSIREQIEAGGSGRDE